MEWGQQMRKHEENARDAMFHNPNYNNSRETKIPVIMDIKESSGAGGQKGLSNAASFSLELMEPLVIDDLSDIYLDSCMTMNCNFGNTQDDTHQFSGSLYTTGSFGLNGYNVTEISNDTSLTDNSQNALVTEYAVRHYVSGLGSAGEQAYLRKQYVKISSGISGNSTASFSAVTASAPAGMTSTTEHDFLSFIKGQYMEHDALEIQQAASTFRLKVDTDSIGYVLESDDEILAWGKFNS